MEKHWRFVAHDRAKISYLERTVGIPPVLAQLLVARGICDPERAKIFLNPRLADLRHPKHLPGCLEAAEKLLAAIRAGKRIVVYGDYDVDGVTATAILCRCIRLLNGKVSYYIPDRIEEGYGLNEAAVRSLAENGQQVLVTVDCGIASPEVIELSRKLGLQAIVTDHHQLGQSLPKADAIVHPALPGGDSGFQELSGAGVAFKLAWALCERACGSRRVSDTMREFLLQSIGLAALGTVADVVPLLDENRILVRHGLVALKQRPVTGVAALTVCAGKHEQRGLDAEDIAFALAPRLNAAGRLGQAQLAVELLLTNDEQRAQQIAEYLEQLNEMRQKLERRILVAAHKQAKEKFDPTSDPALVLADYGWHPGVIGIVAGKLAEKYHRPVVVISLDSSGTRPAVGSARAIPGVNLFAALSDCSNRLLAYGGHEAAAGLTIDPCQVDAFRVEFCEHVAAQMVTPPVPEIRIDAEAPLGALTLRVVEQIERMAPFGYGNPRPVICSTRVRVQGKARLMGAQQQHVAMSLCQEQVVLRAVAFGKSDWAEKLPDDGTPIDIAFQPVINTYRGMRRVELHLVDWRRSSH